MDKFTPTLKSAVEKKSRWTQSTLYSNVKWEKEEEWREWRDMTKAIV